MLTSMMLAMAPAHAAEVTWNGHYRARGLIYDSLSVSSTNAQAEGTSNLFDHRLRLRPGIYVSSRVGVFTTFDVLPLTPYGDTANTWYDDVEGAAIPLAYADGVAVGADAEDPTAWASNFQVRHAYADLYSDIGRFRFGRMPHHWGAGILFNGGFGPESEYGDVSDRLQFTSRAGSVYLMGAWEPIFEGYEGVPDDMAALDFSVAYRAETTGLGLYNRYRYQPSASFNSYTGDLWGYAELGPVKVQTEVAAVFGGGDLDTGANDISIAAVGAMLEAEVGLDRLIGGLELGVATGDAEPDDSKIKTFSFDRDHNVALMMFEEPMPVLEASVITESNGGRDYDAVRTGEGVSNALYLRPWVGWRFNDDLATDLQLFAARAAKVPEDEEANRGYGMEFDLSLRYDPYEHFWVKGTAGVFLPGPYYTTYTHDELGTGFDDVTLGGRLYATVEF